MKYFTDNSGNEFVLEELLPCPFCGYHANTTFIGNDHTKTRRSIIKCSNPSCRCEMAGSTLRHSTEWIAKAMVEQWNRRV